MVYEVPSPVQASVDATNAGDLEAFLASFTPDGVVDDVVRTLRAGAERACRY